MVCIDKYVWDIIYIAANYNDTKYLGVKIQDGQSNCMEL